MPIRPIDRESPFGVDELFFSTTDRRGVIRAGNDIFVRVSGHPEDRLIGSAHNIIRHPDMPRAVFRMVWDALLAGAPIAGYVKNMAADGSHYWVMSAWVPLGDGFLSVRLKPTAGLLATVEPIYREVRALERRLEESGVRRRDVADRSVPRLMELIAAAGFPDYAAFARHALPLEIRARRAALAGAAGRDDPPAGAASGALAAAGRHLDDLFDGLAVFTAAAGALDEGTRFIHELADGVRLNALNAFAATRRLSAGRATLGLVADRMSRCAEAMAAAVAGFLEEVAPTMDALHDVEYRIAMMKAEIDMAIAFALELEGGSHTGTVRARREASLVDLLTCAGDGAGGLAGALATLAGRVRAVERGVERIEATLTMLGALRTVGQIEAEQVGEAPAFAVLFDRVRDQLADAAVHMDGLRGAVSRAAATRADMFALRRALTRAHVGARAPAMPPGRT